MPEDKDLEKAPHERWSRPSKVQQARARRKQQQQNQCEANASPLWTRRPSVAQARAQRKQDKMAAEASSSSSSMAASDTLAVSSSSRAAPPPLVAESRSPQRRRRQRPTFPREKFPQQRASPVTDLEQNDERNSFFQDENDGSASHGSDSFNRSPSRDPNDPLDPSPLLQATLVPSSRELSVAVPVRPSEVYVAQPIIPQVADTGQNTKNKAGFFLFINTTGGKMFCLAMFLLLAVSVTVVVSVALVTRADTPGQLNNPTTIILNEMPTIVVDDTPRPSPSPTTFRPTTSFVPTITSNTTTHTSAPSPLRRGNSNIFDNHQNVNSNATTSIHVLLGSHGPTNSTIANTTTTQDTPSPTGTPSSLVEWTPPTTTISNDTTTAPTSLDININETATTATTASTNVELFGETFDVTTTSFLNLYEKSLTGTLPTELGLFTRLNLLYLWNNQISGNLPSELGLLTRLTSLLLYTNQLTGTLPTEIGLLTKLTSLGLSNNRFVGNIPSELGRMTRLSALRLDNNQMTGSVPSEIQSLAHLAMLYLYENLLTSSIPTELGVLTALDRLGLHSNQLTGPIPTELGRLTKLTVLSLQNNHLTGMLPDGSCPMLSYCQVDEGQVVVPENCSCTSS